MNRFMEGVTIIEDLGAPPESWEVADVEESMKRLMLPSAVSSSATLPPADLYSHALSPDSSNLTLFTGNRASGLSEDAINQVDQFLREALQNPRERLSILRMEQDIESFIRDPMRQQLEFQQLPTSYLRLAAHRVAQHYFLQSVVLSDNSLPDGSGSKIIVRKSSTECQLPRVRLADIPMNLPQEDSGVVKVAIKQRPQKHTLTGNNGDLSSAKDNHNKSVEERKEEYSRARARIFNATNHSGSSAAKPEVESKRVDNLHLVSAGIPKIDEKSIPGGSGISSGRGLVDSSIGGSRSARIRAEKDPVSRYRPSNRVAIFRDREFDRNDPDYDRSYDRYMQRFDPGFGFSAGPYTVQPMYTPAHNYNTEFPQLGSTHGPQVSAEPPLPPPPQHMPGPWVSPSNPAGLGYGHPETMMTAYNPSHVNPHSSSAIYLHSPQYLCQHPGVPFVHTHELVHRPYPQSQQQQHDATLGLARPH